MVKLGLCKEAVIRQWPDRIMIDPDIHHGEPCVRGTRITVSMIIGSLADGMTFDQIKEQVPPPVERPGYSRFSGLRRRSRAPGCFVASLWVSGLCQSR